jgi:hypothetical protein
LDAIQTDINFHSISTGKPNLLFFDKSNRTINLSKKHTLIH